MKILRVFSLFFIFETNANRGNVNFDLKNHEKKFQFEDTDVVEISIIPIFLQQKLTKMKFSRFENINIKRYLILSFLE